MTDFSIHNFASYDAALAMKQIGFEGDCLYSYGYNKNELTRISNQKHNNIWYKRGVNSDWVAAPLFQQAGRWFRGEYGIYIHLDWYSLNDTFTAEVHNLTEQGYIVTQLDKAYNGEHEAWNAAILKACEIVKANN
jgi:hypothetical protein